MSLSSKTSTSDFLIPTRYKFLGYDPNKAWHHFQMHSPWSERIYMVEVDGEKIEVPDPVAWNIVLMEERFDPPHPLGQVSIGYTTRTTDGVMVLAPMLAQSTGTKYPVYIPTIPRTVNALLDQARYCITHAENFPGVLGNRPAYNLNNFVRYLYLEQPQQRERLPPELAERNREEIERIINKFKRKSVFTLPVTDQ